MTLHIYYKCDKCGFKEKAYLSTLGIGQIIDLPKSFKQTNAGDLCHICYNKYKKLVKRWKDES